MERLPEVKDAVAAALLTLGDGNWKMGEGVQVGKGPKTSEADEQTIIEHYMCKSFPSLDMPLRSFILVHSRRYQHSSCKSPNVSEDKQTTRLRISFPAQ